MLREDSGGEVKAFRDPRSTFRVPCSVFHVPRSAFHVPCSVFHVPCSAFRVPRSVFHVPRSVLTIELMVIRDTLFPYRVFTSFIKAGDFAIWKSRVPTRISFLNPKTYGVFLGVFLKIFSDS